MPRSRSLILLAVLSAAPATLVHAAWHAVPNVSIQGGTVDNVLRTASDKQSASDATADASITIENKGQRGSFSASPRLVADKYGGNQFSDVESTDSFLSAEAAYNWRRAAVGFDTYYAHELILNAEFADAIPVNPDAAPGQDVTDQLPDTGRVVIVDHHRDLLNLHGNVDYIFSERNQFRFEVSRQKVTYSGSQNYQTDYDDTAFSVSMIRHIDERNTVSANASVSEFHAVNNDNTTKTIAVQGQFSRPLSPTWTMLLRAGVQRSDYNYLDSSQTRVTNAASSPRFGIGFRKRAERTRWNIDFSEINTPSGRGFVATRDIVRLLATHSFSQRFTGQAGIRLTKTKSLGDTRDQINFIDRDYNAADLRLQYAVKRTMFVYFGYNLIRQDFADSITGPTTANSVYVGFTYRGQSRP